MSRNLRYVVPFLLISLMPLGALAKGIFIPENGKYDYTIQEIADSIQSSGINYIVLKGDSRGQYKYDINRNEYQVKNWFLQDWYRLQDMWSFNQTAFINSQGARTFNEAKRNQFSKFAFDRKNFFHYKTTPSMKEWGGLSHPPVKSLILPLKKYDSNFGPIH